MPALIPDARTLLEGSVLLVVLYALFWQFTTGRRRRQIIKDHGCLPPNVLPAKDPILAVDRFQQIVSAFKARRGLEMLRQRYDAMGVNTYQQNGLGRTLIATIEPDNLKQMQALNFKSWSLGTSRIRNFRVFLGPGIFASDDAEWEHSRAMLRPNFAKNQVRDLEAFEHHIRHLIAAIPLDGSTVDLSELFFRLTMDSATEFLFGESTNTLRPGLSTVSASRFAESFERAQEHLANKGRYGIFEFLVSAKDFKNDCRFVHDFVDTFVEKGLKKRQQLLSEKKSEKYLFLDELVRQTSDKYQIRSELLNILLAGRDTTASLLSNVWWILSKRPDIYANLRQEVDALNGQTPTFEQIRDMKYLRALQNESLRLHPVVPINSREAIEDTWLPRGGGKDGRSPLFIPKGRVVTFSTWSMHRRKDYFGHDADEFRPERWLGEHGLRPGWEYLPFNGGPRICLGQQFALTEASYTTIRLMQTFKAIESRDSEPWREQLTLTCVNAGGCKVSLIPYSNA